MVNASWTARPPDPRCPLASFGSIPPDAANPNPVGTPGGVSGIWPISATVLGSYHPSFRGGGSGLGSLAAEPFAIGWPVLTQRGPWALADALAKRPAEEILFDWFRSGRLVGELPVLIKSRHPEVQAEIDHVYQEHLAKLGKRQRDPATQDD
jgi:hypothetical protein